MSNKLKTQTNDFKARLLGREKQIGFWLSLASEAVTEIAAQSGFDWLLIDMEHSPNELPDVLAQLRVLTRSRVHAVVRPPSNDAVVIKRLLDIGAQTLLIPFVNSAEEASRAVTATRYAPRGARGFSGCTRANRYGRALNYAEEAEREICLLVQVETTTAISHLEEIASVPGVDGVFIGAADLSAELGYPGKVGHPAVWDMVIGACRRLRTVAKPAGILLSQAEDIAVALQSGFEFVAVGSDARLFVSACERLANEWKLDRPSG